MRVENPLEYGTKLMSIEDPEAHYTAGEVREACSAATRSTSTSPKPIPVHLTYQTAFVDDDGKLQLRDDVYGRDAKMIAILKNRPSAASPTSASSTRPNPSSKPVRLPTGTYGGIDGQSYA